MDSVFSFSEAQRLEFLRSVRHTFGCAYICLWSYSSSSNRLLFLDGLYDVAPNHQAVSSSLGLASVDQGLFDQYRGFEFDVTASDNGVPGLAFRNHQYTCLELQQSDLLRLARTDVQRRFFQEARIKTAVFIGCGNGEIELGFSSVVSDQGGKIQTDMRNLFPEEFSRQSHPAELRIINPPSSSSSSSLRSFSTASGPENTSFLFGNNFLGTRLLPEMLQQQENEHDSIVRAILHVISSPSSSSNDLAFHHQQNLPDTPPELEGTCAFTSYRPSEMDCSKSNLGRQQSLLKRSFELFRGLHYMKMRERYQASRPTSTQLLHMISERRRREKLSQNFQALWSLLPPGTKKDKASILTAAKETLNSLMAEIEKMTKGDQQVEAQMKAKQLLKGQETNTSPSVERLIVRVSDVPRSSLSEERFIDLQVTVRGQRNSQVDILIRLLEFLKSVQRVSLVSVDANTRIAQQGTAINEATLRLKIEGSEWDEAALTEAVRRMVADLAN
ncbi:putative transcription factor bHLH041 [Prosopis cineraria]|uniref:putative transcription factor bHLH041 n=1 Tax=Prosopis cineraria TaxID=364024 RepID=UPI00240F3012|nr:putative transcription factor bHLH041 [Prosopis cineraria]